MKKLSLKSKILLGAFLVGGLGAGATEVVSNVVNAQQAIYDWESNVPGQPNQQGLTVSQATSFYGCASGNQICAEGTLVEGSGPEEVTLNRP